ncbi:MAG: hypothetical protein LBB05_01245 [Puniceicoccales bacterium]|jgi:hypothetical protein|nr:hypothetical protein [Puniceicoccales bacterium]
METIKKIIKFIIYVIFWILIVMGIKDFYERSSQNGKDIFWVRIVGMAIFCAICSMAFTIACAIVYTIADKIERRFEKKGTTERDDPSDDQAGSQ